MQRRVWGKYLAVSVFLLMVLSFAGKALAQSDSDRIITSSLENRFQSDSQLKGAKIDVSTDNGEVTLKGTVTSRADITRATTLARSVDGVKEIDNRLKRMPPSSNCNYGGSQFTLGCPVGGSWWPCTADKYK